MGLTNNSTGLSAVDMGLQIVKTNETDRVIGLAGNPNVGKSTAFNYLTGMNQHTGNWPGKTVSNAQGVHHHKDKDYILVDLPGTYSLMAHSAEEEVARDFICFGQADATIVVCDATCLERNLNLVLQTIEINPRVVVCVNLIDEAKKRGIQLNLPLLEENLGVPVVGAVARSGKGMKELIDRVEEIAQMPPDAIKIWYTSEIEHAISMIEPWAEKLTKGTIRPRWLAVKLLDDDPSLVKTIERELGKSITDNQPLQQALNQAHQYLKEQGVTQETLQDKLVACLVKTAELCCEGVVIAPGAGCNLRDRKWDRILTGKWTGIPIMILLLLVIFWITITGANYPSQLLSDGLFWVQDRLIDFFTWLGTPEWVHGVLVLGIYRTLAWVVSVMLPPMAIFFPLFTLLEDFGYLPRVAFNLDHQFKKACACGKQALTMWLEKDGMQMASGQAQAHIYGDKRRGPLCVSIASTPI